MRDFFGRISNDSQINILLCQKNQYKVISDMFWSLVFLELPHLSFVVYTIKCLI